MPLLDDIVRFENVHSDWLDEGALVEDDREVKPMLNAESATIEANALDPEILLAAIFDQIVDILHRL